jgi:hypothetical protein
MISGPSISPPDELRTPTREDVLSCTWSPSGDMTQQNASWYNGTTIYSTSVNDADNTINLSANIARKGERWYCNITMSNGTATQKFSTNVLIKNAVPTPPNATNENLYEDRTKSIQLQSTDADGDTITYHLEDGLPAFCSITQSTGLVLCTPTVSHIGQVNATYYVKDGGIDWPNTNVTYTVISVNDPPTFSVTDQVAIEDTAFYYNISVIDEESNFPVNFTLESNLSFINITATSNTTARITFTRMGNAPDFADKGLWWVRVNATDNGPTMDTPYDDPMTSHTFSLTVTTINQKPNITTNFSGYPGNEVQGNQFTFFVNANDTDGGDNLVFSITTNCSYANPWSITTTNSSPANATGVVNVTLTNNHVLCRWVNMTVSDGEDFDYALVFLNISNSNDIPVMYEMSYHVDNSDNNVNMSNLTAVKGKEFVYYVNVSDPDTLTYEGEVLSFSDNSSTNITVNASTGKISFMPVNGHVGFHNLLINVTDDAGLWDARTLILEVKNNTVPTLVPIGNFSCAEDSICTRFINAIDPDNEDLVFTSNNTAIFNIIDYNMTSWLLNFTPTNAQVGSYPITITVEDNYLFADSESFIFTINNTNDAPFFDTVTLGTIVNTFPVVKRVNVTDDDLVLGLDNLSFSWNFITDPGNVSAGFSFIEEGEDYFVLSFTPSSGQEGFYELNLSVIDNASAMYYQIVNFTIYEQSSNPLVEEIKPYWDTNIQDTVFTSFGNASLFNNSYVEVNATENRTITFDALISNDSSVSNNFLNYYWYVDGVLEESLVKVKPGVNSSFNLPLGFFDAGSKNITLEAIDARFSSTSWTWNLSVSNVNRPVVFYNEMPDISVNRSTEYVDFMSHFTNASGWQQLFYDPDDDLNSNGQRGTSTSESSALTYTIATGFGCSIADISFSLDSLIIVPHSVGVCFARFVATDPSGTNATSNTIQITIADVEVEEVDRPVSSGGGESKPRLVPYPYEVPTETPHPIELITPGEVVTYVDEKVDIPLTIKNTWTESVKGISLNATVSNSTYTPGFSFSVDFIPALAPGEEYELTLTVSDYRQDEPLAVVVSATVSDPSYVDAATIMINAMEKKDNGDDNVESKITFARDLLSDNPECQELNELLDKAEEERLRGNSGEAIKLVTTVMNGCKYLINEQKEVTYEEPKDFFAMMTVSPGQLSAFIVAGIIVLILLVFGILMVISGRKYDI